MLNVKNVYYLIIFVICNDRYEIDSIIIKIGHYPWTFGINGTCIRLSEDVTNLRITNVICTFNLHPMSRGLLLQSRKAMWSK